MLRNHRTLGLHLFYESFHLDRLVHNDLFVFSILLDLVLNLPLHLPDLLNPLQKLLGLYLIVHYASGVLMKFFQVLPFKFLWVLNCLDQRLNFWDLFQSSPMLVKLHVRNILRNLRNLSLVYLSLVMDLWKDSNYRLVLHLYVVLDIFNLGKLNVHLLFDLVNDVFGKLRGRRED